MAFAQSQPLVNQFFGGIDVATAIRNRQLNSVPLQAFDRARDLANATRTQATGICHPLRMARIFRRGATRLLVLDLKN